MAKLNKNEIEAVANKAHRALLEAIEVKKQLLMESYTPSENYTKIMELVAKRDEAQKVLDESKETIYELINKLYHKYIYSCTSKHEIEFLIIQKECNVKFKIPSKDSIIDDVTIAAIERDFDTNKFIEDLISKYNA